MSDEEPATETDDASAATATRVDRRSLLKIGALFAGSTAVAAGAGGYLSQDDATDDTPDRFGYGGTPTTVATDSTSTATGAATTAVSGRKSVTTERRTETRTAVARSTEPRTTDSGTTTARTVTDDGSETRTRTTASSTSTTADAGTGGPAPAGGGASGGGAADAGGGSGGGSAGSRSTDGTTSVPETATPTATPTERTTTAQSTPTTSTTETATTTESASSGPVDDDYGIQGYGEYGYGGVLVRTATGSSCDAVTVTVPDVTVPLGETAVVPVRVSGLTDGLAGFAATLTVQDSAVVTVTDVTVDSAFSVVDTSVSDSEVELSALDADAAIEATTDCEAASRTLARVTVRAETTDATDLGLAVESMNDDAGKSLSPDVDVGGITVTE